MSFHIILFIIAGILLIIAAYIFITAVDGWFGTFACAVIAAVMGGALYQSEEDNSFDHLTASEACVVDNARLVPAQASVSSVIDDRIGFIYPCYYLLDHGIVAGVHGTSVEPVSMRLSSGVSEELFSDSIFTAEGSLNGLLLIGTGFVGGDFSAEQSVERVQVAAFMAETAHGYTSFIVETGSVRYSVCEADCEPTVRIWTSPEPLFTKLNDTYRDDSIWLPSDLRSHLDSLTRGGKPASPGQTVQALATRIDVSLPAELMPGIGE